MEESSPNLVENIVGKGEIARLEQFLLFPQCYQRLVLQARKNKSLFGKGLIQVNGYRGYFPNYTSEKQYLRR